MTLHVPNRDELRKLDEILSDPAGRVVGVLGLGVSGRAMARYLMRRGASVIAADRNPDVASLNDLGGGSHPENRSDERRHI